MNHWNIKSGYSVRCVRKYFMLFFIVLVVIGVVVWHQKEKAANKKDLAKDLANYLENAAIADAFLKSTGVEVYVYNTALSHQVANAGVDTIELPFRYYHIEAAHAGGGVWHDDLGWDGTLVYELYDGEILYEIDIAPLDAIGSVHMSGNGRYVAYSGWYAIGLSGMSKNHVYIYDLETREKHLLFLEKHKRELRSIKLSYNGDILYYSSSGDINSYDVDSGEIRFVANGYEAFPLDNGNVGIIDYGVESTSAKLLGPDCLKEVLLDDNIIYGPFDWDSTGRFIAYLEYGREELQKIETIPHVYDMATGKHYRCHYGYYTDIHISYNEQGDLNKGGVTVITAK